jgi:biotin-dependent carboxylase-like uncharacterized protein
VALAGCFTGVYPRESPGGWQLIGRTDAVMWDVTRDPPALLTPGTRVRFTRMERDAAPAAPGRRRTAPPPRVTRGVEILQAGVRTLVQDAGRPGHAALGVSASGAADRIALRNGNRAVGNQPGAAVVEIVGGAVLRFHGAGVAAVTGAVGDATVIDAAARPRVVRHGAPFATAEGDELHQGPPQRGIRYTVAVRGGLLVKPVLGSRATDTLAGLGPAPLTNGAVIAVGAECPFAVQPDAIPRPLPAPGDLVELPITLGPRDEWFTASTLAVLTDQEWEITARSDRVGIRLHGERPLERAIGGELPSEGAVTGAIQVPPEGQPVIFLPDHPLTGGYPVIGALTDRALDVAGQLPPGARVRFTIDRR